MRLERSLRRLRFLITAICLGLLVAPAAAKAPDADWWSAIKRDDAAAIQTGLLRGVDPQAQNELGNPALTQAVREQSWQVFDILRAAPAVDIDASNARDETALMYLAILGQTARAKAAIQHGAQVNRLGWTPLHYAASKGRTETARMLIAEGAIVNAPGPDGTTPLMMAGLSGSTPTARLLLESGADPSMVNTAGATAADWARKSDSNSLAAALDKAAQRADEKRRQATAESRADAADRPQTDDTPDESSFSRYFDLNRFDEDARKTR